MLTGLPHIPNHRNRLFQLNREANATGLERPGQVMIEKLVTVSRSAISSPIGALECDDLLRVQ